MLNFSIKRGSDQWIQSGQPLRGHPNVRLVHHTTGRWDLIAEISTDNLVSFNRVVGEIRMINGVSSTETNLLLDSF